MIKVFGVSVVLYCLCLVVLGILLFLYSAHGMNIEGFQVGGTSSSGSGTYVTGPPVFVRDCTGTTRTSGTRGTSTECVSINKNTDRLTYFQRLPVGGSLVSTNGRYSLKYRADGMLILYDEQTMNILWRSNTKGTSQWSPSHLINIGAIEARSINDTVMPWIATPASAPSSGSPSAPSSGSPSTPSSGSPSPPSSGSPSPPIYSIPSNPVRIPGIYLQVTDYGDLVVINSAGGSTLWRSNTGDPPPPPSGCVPMPMIYPFTQEDCFDLQKTLALNSAIIDGTADAVELPLIADTTPNVYMPPYCYMFGSSILPDFAPMPVTLIKVVGGVNIYIVEVNQTLKMVADDTLGTAKSYTVPAGAAWSGVVTSWNDGMWTSGTAAGARTDGQHMLYLEGRPITLTETGLATPAFIKTTAGRIISMYGSAITNKLPVTTMKKVGDATIYISQTFTNYWGSGTILMVADDAVGTAKALTKTATVHMGAWANSYWTTAATSMGVSTDGRCKLDKDDIFPNSSTGSGSQKPLTRTTDIIAAKAASCNLQPYYNDRTPDNPNGLGCAAYLRSNPNPSSKWKVTNTLTSTTGGSAITPPAVSITGSIANLSNQLTPNMDLTSAVRVDDMIYLGYLLDVQGPFVVASITPTTITFTKKYIGPSLSNSILSVVSSIPFTDSPASNPRPVTGPTGPREKEVYVFGAAGAPGTFNLATAEVACASFGGTVATYNQMMDAYSTGAHWCLYSLIKNDTTGNPMMAFPIQTDGTCVGAPRGLNQTTATTGGALACYGIKPPQGTSYTVPGTTTPVYINPFSKPWSPTFTPNDSSVQTLYNGPSVIDGTIYPGTSYITTTNSVLPDSLDIGDLIYITAPCNKYDTDLGDGRCRAYDCNPGELDTLQNNECQSYRCREIVNYQFPHIKNANGTCTVPHEYTPCPNTYEGNSRVYNTALGDSGQLLPDGSICTYKINIPTTPTYHLRGILGAGGAWHANRTGGVEGEPYLRPNDESPARTVGGLTVGYGTYSVKQAVNIPSFSYDIIQGGVRDTLVTKTTSNPSYTYPKMIGPFIVSSIPSINKILFRSYRAGDLDANGKLLPVGSGISLGAANALLSQINADLVTANARVNSENTELNRVNTALTSANNAVTSLQRAADESEGNRSDMWKKLWQWRYANLPEYQPYKSGIFWVTPIIPSQPPALPEIGYRVPARDTSEFSQNSSLYINHSVKLTSYNQAADQAVSRATELTTGQASAAAAARKVLLQTIILSNAQSIVSNLTTRSLSLSTLITSITGTSATATADSLHDQAIAALAFANQMLTTANNAVSVANAKAEASLKAYNDAYATGRNSLGRIVVGSPLATLQNTYAADRAAADAAVVDAPREIAHWTAEVARANLVMASFPSTTSSRAIQNRVPMIMGRQNVRIYKAIYDSTTTPASGSTGPKVSLTKKILGCPAGTFGPECTPCPPGKYSTGQITAATNNTQCSTCIAGHYCAGGTNAIRCPAGHSSSTGQTSCTPCSAGQTSYDGGVSCSPCAAGYYCVGGSAPVACSPGTSSVAGSSSCSTCTAGYYCSGGTVPAACTAGTYSTAGAASCNQCSTGTYSAPAASSCFTCLAGNYLTAGATRCLRCQQDAYSNAGDTSCTPCPPGLYSNPGDASCSPCGYGATSSSCLGILYTSTNYTPGFSMTLPSVVGEGEPFTVEAIIPDNPPSVVFEVTNYMGVTTGRFTVFGAWSMVNNVGTIRYSYTFPGSYSTIQPGRSYSQQVISIKNNYSPVGEAVVTSVYKCTGSQRYDPFTSSCIACPAGRTSEDGNKLSCTPCVAGTYANTGNITCTICEPGTYSALGASTCTQCPAGTSSSVEGTVSCSPCPQGTTSSAGALFCAPPECVTTTISANCLPYTNTIKNGLLSISGPYVIRSNATSFTVTTRGINRSYLPTDVKWMIDGVQQLNTCTSPYTCTFTIPPGHSLPHSRILVEMRSSLYTIPALPIAIIP